MFIPQVVLLDTSDSPHLANFRSSTNNLDSHVGLGLDGSIFVVCELGWCGIGVPFDIARDQLWQVLVSGTRPPSIRRHYNLQNVHEQIRIASKDQPGQRNPVG